MGFNPANKDACLPGIGKLEDRRSLHGIVLHRTQHAPAQIDKFDAPIVTGHKCPLGCGHRNQEVTPRVFAIDM